MTPEDNFEIVVKMGESFRTKYLSYRDALKDRFRTSVIIEDDVFTSHGYDHCIRIFRALDNLFLKNHSFYDHISEEELFCLALSILYHDIIMTTDPQKRYTHSEEAKKLIRLEFEKAKKNIIAAPLSNPVIDAIGDIVYAHSDPKSDDGKTIKERSLVNVKDTTHQGTSGKPIQVGFLGALLRFGDELDCTAERIDACQGLYKEEQIANNSHWRKCELIRSIKPVTAAGNEIVLEINDFALQDSSDQANDIKLVHEVIDKLSTSLREINEHIFHAQGVPWWHFNTIRLTEKSAAYLSPLTLAEADTSSSLFNNPNPSNILATPLEPVSSHINNAPAEEDPSGQTPNERATETTDNKDKTEASVIIDDQSINCYLEEQVINENLFKSGHFAISPDRHVRDWIVSAN